MGNKRLELQDGWATLVIGEELSRARKYIINVERSDGVFNWYGEWRSEFLVRKPTIGDVLPAEVYFRRLENAIKSCEEYNDYEKANALLYGEMDLVEITEEVYALRDKLKRILESTYDRLKKRSQAVHEALMRSHHIATEYEREIVYEKLSRKELLQELQYGRLEETAETKTLYEMYDDGYRWQA